MKKIIIFTMFLFCAMSSIAQTLDEGLLAYEAGEYNKAKVILNKYRKNNASITTKYENCATLQAYYENAKELYDRKLYNKALNVCDKVLAINPMCAKTLDLKHECEKGIEALQKERQDLFDAAKAHQSVEEFNAFKQKYKNQSEWVKKADDNIEEISLYKQAEKVNTRDSYVAYLQNSKIKAYEDNANFEIGKFDCETEWASIENTRDLSKFKSFLDKYGKYKSHNEEAENHITFLSGLEAARSGNWGTAYRNLNAAKTCPEISFTNDDDKLFSKVKEEYEYEICNKNSISALLDYTVKYPKSDKFNSASDNIALLKANNLDWMSSVSDRQEAMSFAKSDGVKTIVQDRLDYLLKEKRQHNREMYGPKITVGLVFNGGLSLHETGNLGVGLNARFGRFNQFLNGTLGVRYEAMFAGTDKTKSYTKDNTETNVLGHQIIVPVGLRFNVVKLSNKSRMYVGGTADFVFSVGKSNIEMNYSYDNEKIGKVLEKNYITYTPCIGIQSHHWDFNVYYTMYSKSPFVSAEKNPNMEYLNNYSEKVVNTKECIGMTLGYYF